MCVCACVQVCVYVCVPVCVCVCICACVHMCVFGVVHMCFQVKACAHVQRTENDTECSDPNTLSLILLNQGLSVNPERGWWPSSTINPAVPIPTAVGSWAFVVMTVFM